MPPVVAAINVVLANVAMAVTGSLAAGQFMLAYGLQTVMIASSIAYSAIQQRKLKKALKGLQGGAGVDQGRAVMAREPVAPRRLIYGQAMVSGPIIYMATSGSTNEYLHMVIVLAGHECQELGDIYFNDELVPLSGNTPSSGPFVGYARVKKFLGIAAGERDTDLESESAGDWTSSHLGKGIARLHVRLKYSTDVFPNGIPVIKCLVKGKKVYDPRSATTAWSANAALCVGDFLMDSTFGKSIALARIRSSEWQEAANICDEDVVLDDLSTEKRYTCNGTVLAGNPNETLLDLVGSMAGHLCDTGGQWTIRAGAWRAPALTFTDSDIVGAFSCTPRQSRQDSYNGVRGTYIGPLSNYAPADFPVVKNDTYKAADGNLRLWKDIGLNFTNSPATAQRLAKIDLEVGRQQIIVAADFSLKAMQCQPGDVIALTRARMGWSAKHFEVVGWEFKVQGGDEGKQGPSLAIAMTLRETAEGVWDWNDGEETVVDLAPNTSLYDPRTVATATGLTLSTSNFVQPDGTITPRIQVQWTADTDIYVVRGRTRIEFKKTADSAWIEWGTVRGDLSEDFILGVETGVAYDVRVQFENFYGVRGAFDTDSITVTSDATAPATPTGLTATPGPGCNIIDWADNAEDDLDHYELLRSTTNTIGTATVIWTGYASQHADFDVTVGVTYYYWLKAADTTDNLSGATASVNSAALNGSGGYTDYVFKRAATIPATPTGNTPAGWSDAPPAADGNPLWMSTGDKTSAGVLVGVWSTPVQIEGGSVEFEYSIDGATLWHSTFTSGDLFARHRVGDGSFTAAYRIVGEDGTDGEDGNFRDTVYKRAATIPSTPTGDGVPSGWDRSPPAADGNPLWMSTATKTAADVLVGSWATPVRITGDTGATGPALSYSLTIDWHPSGLAGGYINGTYYSGTSTTVTGLNPGAWVDISADSPANGDNWTSWGGADTDQLESGTGTNSNRILMGGNLGLIANY